MIGSALFLALKQRAAARLALASKKQLKQQAAAPPAVAVYQCRKTRTPVKAMAMPRSSAAAMTSSSRIEPPG